MCLGVPMKVSEILPDNAARVQAGEVSLQVSLQLLEDVRVDDYVLVHAGFALEVLDLEAAKETLELLNSMTAIENRGNDLETGAVE
jgi:hydrogenase expression/formation protein HypC